MREEFSVHEVGHAFTAFALGGGVRSVEVREDGGFTSVERLSRYKRLKVAVAGLVAERVFGGEKHRDGSLPDYVQAFEMALSVVDATEAAAARRRGPRPPEVGERRRVQRARRLVDLAEEQVEGLLRANGEAVADFAAALSERGRLEGGEVEKVFSAALAAQEATCSSS